MIYIEELKVRVINKFGKNVASKPDAQELRDVIFLFQKEYLSESTIRRFFHLIPSGIASSVTLDILSRYIGFKSYLQFCEFCEKIVQFATKSDTDQLILSGFKSKKSLTLLEVNLISYRITQCIMQQAYDLLCLYFNDESFYRLLTSNESIHDMFAQTMGPYIESDSYIQEVDVVLKSRYFIPLILHKYIDIQNKGLEKYYTWMSVNYDNKLDGVLAASILSLNRVYSANLSEAQSYFHLIKEKENITSPVLNGRIALLEWIFSDNFDYLIQKAQLFEKHLMHFSIDILCYLVYFNKIEALKIWFLHFPNTIWNQTSWVEKEIIHFITLAKYISKEDYEGLRQCMAQKIFLMNSKTIFHQTYKLIEERFLKKA